MLIAKYTASASGVLPTFNNGYQYTVNETNSNGIYIVELYSDTDFTSCSFNGKSNLLTVEYLKVTSNVTSLRNMFYNCINLTSANLSDFNTSNVTVLYGMFNRCSNLTSLDLSSFNTSSVTTMAYMFYNCSNLTSLDLSNFNTSNATNLAYMFHGCSKLTSVNLSSFNTSMVANMSYMFYGCSKLTSLDLSSFNTSRVANMPSMFNNCSQLIQIDVSNWNTSNVINTDKVFTWANNLIHIGMVYCDLDTINKLSNLLPTTKAKQVYVHDVSSSECTEVNNITFIDYISDSESITLPIILSPNDEVLWDDSSQRYIIKCSNGTTIQTDITSKFKIDLYTPYTMIYGDNVTSISVNINRKEM